MNADVQRGQAADFLSRERGRLVGVVRRWLRDAAEAEDIVQDVALNIFDQADFTVPVANLSAYIYQALRNRMVDFFRRRRKHRSLDEPTGGNGSLTLAMMLQDMSRDTAREAEKRILLRQVYRAIDRLNPEDRAVLVATELEGRPFRELAEEWDVPLGTLLARKARALGKIRRAIGLEQNKT